MAVLSLIALALHVLGASLWLGGALSVTRVASAADATVDPSARAALVASCKKLLRAVCAPWMTVATAGAVALLVLGPPRKVRALLSLRSFWVELSAGVLLYLLQRALERRVSRVAKQALPEPERPARAELDEGEARDEIPVEKQEKSPYSPKHVAPLRRLQRAMLLLTIVAVFAAVSRR